MLNTQIFFIFYNLAHQSKIFDALAVFIAKPFPNLVILLAVIFLLFHHEVLSFKNRLGNEAIWDSFRILKQKWKEIVLVFFSGIFAWGIAHVIKVIVQSPRPYLVLENVFPLLAKTDFSFPSGHATFFMALATAIFLSHKKAGYLFGFFALLIGLARIITGVHFPVDILGGYILGALIAYLVRLFYDRINKK
jgi:membrane-associated phospholipid phosphatase